MRILRILTAVLVSILPMNALRVLGYRLFLGYQLRESRLGFGTVIAVDEASITHARLGFFNLLIGPMKIRIERGASIGNRNTFSCGYWVLKEEHRAANYARTLEIGAETLITSNHHFDVAGSFTLGDRSWIAGIGSQFWTHGVGVRDRNIEIGTDCYVGSAVRFAPGSSVGNNVLVAMGSVVADPVRADNALVGGVPARVIRSEYDWKAQYE